MDQQIWNVITTISGITGGFLIIGFILFTFISSFRNLIDLIFYPLKYIQNNHKDILNTVVANQFGDRVRSVIDTSILETLKDTGVTRGLDKQKGVLLILARKFQDLATINSVKNYRVNLLKIIKDNSTQVESKVGIKSVTTYSHYVNLRNVLPNSQEASTASYILAGFIYEHIETAERGYDFVAVNRNSNAILGYLISNILDIPLLIVNYHSRWEINGKKIEIDGLNNLQRPHNKRGFLVDDAVSGGSILKESCNTLRDNGLTVDDVFVLFSRKEDDAKSDFKRIDIDLHSVFELNDELIEKIISTPDNKLDELVNEI